MRVAAVAPGPEDAARGMDYNRGFGSPDEFLPRPGSVHTGVDVVRVCYVAEQAEGWNGWGRYTAETVRAIRDRGIEPVLVTAPSSVDPRLRDVERHEILPRPLAGRWSGLRSLAAAGALRRVLASCDIVHGMVEPYGPLIGFSHPARMPYVQTAHGSWSVVPLRSRLRRWFYATGLRRVDLLVVQSRYTRDQIRRYMPLPPHVVAPAGVSIADFAVPSGSALPSWAGTGPLVLSVGALRPHKGHHVTLEAVGRVASGFPAMHYALIGDDDKRGYRDRLQQRASELGLADRIHFLGRVAFAELAAWYRRAHVFILLPVNQGGSFEGLGLTYLEAAACGTPSVATEGCGAAEAVIHEETGLLVPQDDASAAAQALRRMLGDSDLRGRLGEAAHRRASQFSWGHLADTLKQSYEELVAAKRTAAA